MDDQAVLDRFALKTRASTRPIGWAYWLKDHWHLCAEEPVAHDQRQPIYLRTGVQDTLDALAGEMRHLAKGCAAMDQHHWANVYRQAALMVDDLAHRF